ncbi:MAG: methyltransferase domain-containing protein [Henriciella sp.]|nr:methyltransferase domain-containing protein [Henriciella sp.]
MGLIREFVAGRTPPELYEEYLTPGFFKPWTDRLIAQSPPSGRVLDVACGTGAVSRAIARHASNAVIDAIDVAPPMLQFGEAETARQELSDRISFHQASADRLPFEADTFDHLYCQQGLQFFPDKVAALTEMKRVMKPGAKLALSVWTAADNGNPAFEAFETLIAARLGADLVPFGPFSYPDIEAVRQVASDAGLTIESLEQQSCMARLPTPRTLVLFDLLFLGRPAEDGSLQPLFDPTDASKDEEIQALITTYGSAIAEFVEPDGTIHCPSSANVLIATA